MRIGSSWRNDINKKGVMIEDVITFLPDTETKKIPSKCILKQDWFNSVLKTVCKGSENGVKLLHVFGGCV